MVEIEQIQVLIGSLGFPIVAFLLVFTKLLPLIEKMNETVSNNTKAIERIFVRLGVDDNDK